MKNILFPLFFSFILVFSCSDDKKSDKVPAKKPQKTNQLVNGKKEGLHVLRAEDGKFMNKINYKNGMRHGTSYDYYRSGKLRAEINYKNNEKEGKALWYFDGVNVHRENNYKENVLHGTQRKYYKNGQSLSILEFYEGEPAVGLQEWSENGKELISSTSLKVSRKGHYLVVKLSSGNQKVDFFYGDLIQDKFLHNQLLEITEPNGQGRIHKSKIKDLNKITVSASYNTYLKNKRVITKTVKWSDL